MSINLKNTFAIPIKKKPGSLIFQVVFDKKEVIGHIELACIK